MGRPCPTWSRRCPTLGKTELPAQLAQWLDGLDETGRWALLKLVTGALRIGVSARLAKTAVAALGGLDPDEIEIVWPSLKPPYRRSVRLGGGARRAAAERRSGAVPPADAVPRHRGGGFRRARSRGVPRGMEMGRHPGAGGGRPAPDGRRVARLYSRTGEDISASFPDLVEAFAFRGRARRRAPDHAGRPRAVLQRAAAAAQPQDRDAEAARRIPRASARL